MKVKFTSLNMKCIMACINKTEIIINIVLIYTPLVSKLKNNT